jgi:2-dehydropantoate 2-reductase
MRIAIVGAGSIGGALGARLARAGHAVSMVARGAHLAAIRARGLTLVDHLDGGTHVLQVPASDHPRDLGPQDLVVVTLKAHQIAGMLPQLGPLLEPGTVVVPAINGLPWWYFLGHAGAFAGRRIAALDPDGTMFAALEGARLLGCVVHVAAEVRAPGEVHHTAGRRLIVGELDGRRTARLARVTEALDGAGFQAEASDDIRLAVWTKLLGNTSFNPIAALTGYRMDQIVGDEAVLDVIRPMIREGQAVAERLGVHVKMTADERIALARQIGAARISMLQDLEQRRPLEIPAIVDAVIEVAAWVDVPVPTIRMVRALIAARARTLGLLPGAPAAR